MSPETIVTLGREALELTTLLMAWLLVPALIVGLLVSLFQAVTQINEMTLSFIPKLLVTVGIVVLGGPYLLGILTDYTERLYRTIPTLIG